MYYEIKKTKRNQLYLYILIFSTCVFAYLEIGQKNITSICLVDIISKSK